MKKLLLFLLLLISTIGFSQISEHYDRCLITNSVGEKTKWLKTDFTLICHEKELKVDFIFNNKKASFNVIGAKENKTESGYVMYELEL